MPRNVPLCLVKSESDSGVFPRKPHDCHRERAIRPNEWYHYHLILVHSELKAVLYSLPRNRRKKELPCHPLI